MTSGEEPKKGESGDRHFLRIAFERGLLTQRQLDECLRTQEQLLNLGQHRSLAEIATQKTLISQSHADRIEKEALPDQVPKMAGNYEVLRKIGEGGMGTVYRARHPKLGNYAAVKFLPARLAQDENFVQRFEREAKLAAQLSSAYSVRTFDVGEAEGTRFILMEYVEGESLDELLSRESRLDEKRALRIIRDVASALEEAHEAGIIHRDIKPGNILLTRRGVPKLADLGLARNVGPEQSGLTSAGAILGTPSYMSPEQAMGLSDLDARSDIFSLGATLYRMVVGDLPFKGETPVNVMHKIATESIEEPLERNPALSRETAAVICKMMARERTNRYQTMDEVIQDIEAILSGNRTGLKYETTVALVKPTEHPARAGGAARKRRRIPALAWAACAILVVGAGVYAAAHYGLFGAPPPEPAEPAAAAPEHVAVAPPAPPVKEPEKIATAPVEPPVKEPEKVATAPVEPPVKEPEKVATAPVEPPVKEPEKVATAPAVPPPGMIAVPAGTYSLGMKYLELPAQAPDNSPEHSVRLSKFFIDVHEVTNEQFQKFVSEGGYTNDRWWGEATGVDRSSFVDSTGKPGPRFWSEGRFPEGLGKLPVAGISFYEANAYTRCAGKDLPTEAEWECAALGIPPQPGDETFGKQAFPWGDSYERDNANLADANVGRPEAAGTHRMDKSSFGCLDMTGNVREWTSSTYDPYPGTKCRDERFGKGMATVRGASCDDSFLSVVGVSPTARHPLDKTARDARVGFRCVWRPAARPDGP